MSSGTILLTLAETLVAATAGPAPKSMAESLKENLLTPIPLCFALGIFCKLIHGGIKYLAYLTRLFRDDLPRALAA